MQSGWKTHQCYAENGVDGSFCSFAIYLSEVENYCPYFPWRKKGSTFASQADFATVVDFIKQLYSYKNAFKCYFVFTRRFE